MSLTANAVVALIGLLHVYILVLEMFLWDKPAGLRAFGQTQQAATASKVLAANQGLFRHKVGAAVTAVRRGGAISAFDTMTHFLHSKEMFLVGSTYWNMVYGRDVGEVEQDQEGMANMKNLGQNMAWLLKKIHRE